MGFISNLIQSSAPPEQIISAVKSTFPGQGESRRIWDRVFGAVSKEDAHPPKKQENSNSYVRSLSSAASFKRLLEAMRSDAPGGWSDDRYTQTGHFHGIAYVAIHRICTQWSQAEFQVYEKDDHHPDGKKPVTKQTHPTKKNVHPYELIELLEKPNRQDWFGQYLYRLGQQKYLTGNALTWMVPNELGTPYELYCIPTAIAIPQPVINPEFPNGFYRIQPVYPYGPFSSYPTPNTAIGAPIPGEWMMKFQFPHPLLRYDGYSPLTGMRLTLDVIEAIYRSRWYAMKRSINPSAVLNMEGIENANILTEEEIERLRAMFEESHMGPENVGQLLIPTPGAKIEPWGAKPIEMDYSMGWEQETGFAMGGFGISKEAAGMVADNSYATLFATLKQLHLLTLEPDLNGVASELTRHLAPFFGDNLIIEIRCKRIDDHEVRNSKIQLAMSAKCITKNQVLKELEMPTTREPWGDEMAGESSEPEVPAGGMGGGGGGGDMGGGMGGIPGGMGEGDLESEGIADIEPGEEGAEAPTPGTLNEGSLGPRGASLMDWRKKRLDGIKSMNPDLLDDWVVDLIMDREKPLYYKGEEELLPLCDALEEVGFDEVNLLRKVVDDFVKTDDLREHDRGTESARRGWQKYSNLKKFLREAVRPFLFKMRSGKSLFYYHTKSAPKDRDLMTWLKAIQIKLVSGFNVEIGEELLVFCDALEEASYSDVHNLRTMIEDKLSYFRPHLPQIPYENEDQRYALNGALARVGLELYGRLREFEESNQRLSPEEVTQLSSMLEEVLLGETPMYYLEIWLEEYGATPQQIEDWSKRWWEQARRYQEIQEAGYHVRDLVEDYARFDAQATSRMLGAGRSGIGGKHFLNGYEEKSLLSHYSIKSLSKVEINELRSLIYAAYDKDMNESAMEIIGDWLKDKGVEDSHVNRYLNFIKTNSRIIDDDENVDEDRVAKWAGADARKIVRMIEKEEEWSSFNPRRKGKKKIPVASHNGNGRKY